MPASSKPQHLPPLMRTAIVMAVLLHASPLLSQESSSVPSYVRVDSGWLGLFGHGNEYARFLVMGPNVQIQDANHLMVRPNLGLMNSFVGKQELNGSDLLLAHARWEADYWRDHAARVDTSTRLDLARGRADVRVTRFTLWNPAGDKMIVALVGLRTSDGVYAFAFSPAGPAVDKIVSRFVQSLEIVHRPLTPQEIAFVSQSVKRTRQ